MIIVKLNGGLGNQLFQYATGRYLAEKNSTALKLDVSGYETDKFRKYDLHCFNIKEQIASGEEIGTFKQKGKISFSRFISKIQSRLEKKSSVTFKVNHNKTIVKDWKFSFDPSVLEARGNIYIEGYWQSEKYFLPIRNILLEEIVVKYEQDAINKEFARNIQNTESVSIHFRRGDYVHNPSTSNYHGLCSYDYYMKAVDQIAQKMSNCHFYLFSDDHTWVNENIKLQYPVTMVDHNDDDTSYEDLRLMSLCKHNIIANSSFSWWGAWLNRNPDKIVIAPVRWFANESRNSQIKDLIPETWIQF